MISDFKRKKINLECWNVRFPLYFRAELAKLVSQILLYLLACILDTIPDSGRHL